MFDKVKQIFNNYTNSDALNVYIKYFDPLGKTIKVGRGGIRLFENGEMVEQYADWDDLNEVYKQFPTLHDKAHQQCIQHIDDKDIVYGKGVPFVRVKDEVFLNWFEVANHYFIPVKIPKNYVYRDYKPCKYWVWGSENDWKDICKVFNEYAGYEVFGDSKTFNNKNRVYFLNSEGYLCESSSGIVIDILQNSSDWTEIRVMDVKSTNRYE